MSAATKPEVDEIEILGHDDDFCHLGNADRTAPICGANTPPGRHATQHSFYADPCTLGLPKCPKCERAV